MPPWVALALGICPVCAWLFLSALLVLGDLFLSPLVSDASFLALLILDKHLKPSACLLRTFQIHTAIVSPLSSLGLLDWLDLISTSHPSSHRDAVILRSGALFLYPRHASNDTGTRTELLFLLPPQSNNCHLTEVSLCSYLDASAFGDHDLPHAVEAVEVWLWEAGGEDGSPALSEVATTWHWEETWVGQRFLGSSLRWFHESLSMCLPRGLEPWGSAEPPSWASFSYGFQLHFPQDLWALLGHLQVLASSMPSVPSPLCQSFQEVLIHLGLVSPVALNTPPPLSQPVGSLALLAGLPFHDGFSLWDLLLSVFLMT